MNKQHYFFISVAAIFLIIFLAIFIVQNYDFSEYEYSVTKGNVEFVSNSAEPGALLQDAKSSDVFIVAPRFVEKGTENGYMVSAVTNFSAVLAAKQKSAIIVGRVFDENGELVKCESNLGDSLTSERLSAEECKSVLSDSGSTIILVDFPNNGINRVIVEKNFIRIIPASFDSVGYVSYVVLENLYSDTPQIIGEINKVVDSLR